MRLICKNVERTAETSEQIERLKCKGFKPMDETKEVLESVENIRNIAEMTVTELKALAKEKGIDGAASLTKEELLTVLKDVI